MEEKGVTIHRAHARALDSLRTIRITRGYSKYAEGSVLIECGETHIVCTASVTAGVPKFLKGTNQGWITAEYGMLPRSTNERMQRESKQGGPSGRTQEIQRLIGRSLRSAVDLKALGDYTIVIDCDVLQADGGTRTAAITGAYIALSIALRQLVKFGRLKKSPIRDFVAATSVGIVGGVPMLDLCYQEDSQADVDMNVVMAADGELVEVQATGERSTFPRKGLDTMLNVAATGIQQIFQVTQAMLDAER